MRGRLAILTRRGSRSTAGGPLQESPKSKVQGPASKSGPILESDIGLLDLGLWTVNGVQGPASKSGRSWNRTLDGKRKLVQSPRSASTDVRMCRCRKNPVRF